MKKSNSIIMRYEWFEEYVSQIKNSDIIAAKEILLDNVPDGTLIYRYCKGLNRDVTNLYCSKLWLSNVLLFNDPYDSAIMVDCGFKLQYPKEQREQAMNVLSRQQKEDRNSKEIQKSLFVACFSEMNNSFPMWGYYAADHKGLCIGYDLRELIRKYDCMPVIYSSELVTYKERDLDRNILLATLTKSDEWQHEKEWRIIKKDDLNKGEHGIILENFPKPLEMFVGCRRKEVDSEIEKLCTERFENYADMEDIMECADVFNIDLYYPLISRIQYKLIDKGYKLNS